MHCRRKRGCLLVPQMEILDHLLQVFVQRFLQETAAGIMFLILQYALYCNGYDPGTFDGVYDSEVSAAVSAFQSFMCLPVTGVANMPTIKALLCSSGDTNRAGTACDCSTIITAQTAQTIKANGYQIVGRYLTGTVGGTRSKAITKARHRLSLMQV